MPRSTLIANTAMYRMFLSLRLAHVKAVSAAANASVAIIRSSQVATLLPSSLDYILSLVSGISTSMPGTTQVLDLAQQFTTAHSSAWRLPSFSDMNLFLKHVSPNAQANATKFPNINSQIKAKLDAFAKEAGQLFWSFMNLMVQAFQSMLTGGGSQLEESAYAGQQVCFLSIMNLILLL